MRVMKSKGLILTIVIMAALILQGGLFLSSIFGEERTAHDYGDVDGNGKVTVQDALQVLKHVVGLEQIQGELNEALADLDGDGDITVLDALEILKTVVGLEPVREYVEITGTPEPGETTPTETRTPENTKEPEETEAMKMKVQIEDAVFTAALEENAAVCEFVEMMRQGPVTIQMRDYGSFEKVGSLGKSLTASDRQTTTVAGDIVLYNGDQIVMFYGSNSWSYTRLGHIDDLTGWEDALGSGNITAVFTIAE